MSESRPKDMANRGFDHFPFSLEFGLRCGRKRPCEKSKVFWSRVGESRASEPRVLNSLVSKRSVTTPQPVEVRRIQHQQGILDAHAPGASNRWGSARESPYSVWSEALWEACLVEDTEKHALSLSEKFKIPRIEFAHHLKNLHINRAINKK